MKGMNVILGLTWGAVVVFVIFAAAFRSAAQVSGPVKVFFETIALAMLIILIPLILVLVILFYEKLLNGQFS